MRLAALLMGLLCVALITTPLCAQTSEADRATARSLALEGHSALQKKDYAKAADRFGRADSLVHAPTLVVDWARALQGLGRFVEAHEKYELVIREGVDSTAPKSWTRALEDAKKELEQLKPRLAWITVIVSEPSDASVAIDGVHIPSAALGVKRAADPGFPEVSVTKDGYEPFKQTVAIGAGEVKSVEVSLTKLPEASAPVVSTDPQPPAQHGAGRRTGAYVALGVGAAGLVAGGVTGVLLLKKRSDLREQCLGETCSSASQKTLRAYHTYGVITPIALGAGVIGVGLGVTLLLTEPKSADASPSAAGARVRRVSSFSWRPLVGIGVVGAEGTFQ